MNQTTYSQQEKMKIGENVFGKTEFFFHVTVNQSRFLNDPGQPVEA